MSLSFERRASGELLLLLHAFGMSRFAWKPVADRLAAERELILVDLPGHGDSPLQDGIPPSPLGYAQAVVRLLDELGLDRVHVAGSSIGGWTALEIAKLGRAKSVVALAPAGFWPDEQPLYRRVRFRVEHFGAKVGAPLARLLLRSRLGRRALLGETVATAGDLSPEDAIALMSDFGRIQQIGEHGRHRRGHFQGGQSLDIPVTVVWGGQDRLIKEGSRRLDELPASARVVELPGAGHLMAWDRPEAVADAILRGSS
jgi:pimeloyl-ACP methyl ester carboxylesterase